MRSLPPVLIRTALLYADAEVFNPIKSIQLCAGVCALKRKNPLVVAFDETPRISFDVDAGDWVMLGIDEFAAIPREISLIRGTSPKSGVPVVTLKVPLISITGAKLSCVSTVAKFLLTLTALFRFVRGPVTETTPAWLMTIELFWSGLPV
jgi:hypothetical protein